MPTFLNTSPPGLLLRARGLLGTQEQRWPSHSHPLRDAVPSSLCSLSEPERSLSPYPHGSAIPNQLLLPMPADKEPTTPVCPHGPAGKMPRELLTVWRGLPRVRTRHVQPRVQRKGGQGPCIILRSSRTVRGSSVGVRDYSEGQCPQTQQRAKGKLHASPSQNLLKE